jgi:5-methylcytosine-specific restriction protein A
VPWISVFDPAITTSATRGYYVVYLFHAHEPVVHLSLTQGTTAVREEFAGKAREVLADRAEFMRKRVAEYGAMLPAHSIDLGSTARLPGDYVAGHALGCSYALDALPAEAVLRTDLQNVVRAYPWPSPGTLRRARKHRHCRAPDRPALMSRGRPLRLFRPDVLSFKQCSQH